MTKPCPPVNTIDWSKCCIIRFTGPKKHGSNINVLVKCGQETFKFPKSDIPQICLLDYYKRRAERKLHKRWAKQMIYGALWEWK